MACMCRVLLLWTLVNASFLALSEGQQIIRASQCTYYGSGRVPEEAYSLSNCTWFRERSCCRHTEVTSVFKGMMALNEASQDCRNHMNYLMCYFCSPEQERWYKNSRLHVCESLCDAVYEKCKDSSFQGKEIGAEYSNGKEFCEAQFFHVVNSKDQECFDFDSGLFGTASCLSTSSTVYVAVSLICLKYWL
ncbi:predicted protein [Nematostella vectensis]|uniref:Folate receptor-like domain-containing protein n=1 Tax=Nematostella vectensis TaxID=45351 RepID=A7RPJ5_NEMVE|nr:riboflavin-binding protein [Nematostella vectensis]EDO46522.1 predicted protein [Nematostella vectensis]|eukprot:XP_001638585.1 predicted protein [Nematostella vectensis]